MKWASRSKTARVLVWIAAILTVLIVLFYIEEDWRGARILAATKAEWAAKGESFDYRRFIPPPVPDAQNLAALPLFKLKSATTHDFAGHIDTSLEPPNLPYRAKIDSLILDDWTRSDWQYRKSIDVPKLKEALDEEYPHGFRSPPPPTDALAEFNALYPFFNKFLADAAGRPFCRPNQAYAALPATDEFTGFVQEASELAVLLTRHAILALDQHRPDLALTDVQISYLLASAAGQDPTRNEEVFQIAHMVDKIDSAIFTGLAHHTWTDGQLAQLERTCSSIDWLEIYEFDMRSAVVNRAFFYIKNPPLFAYLEDFKDFSVEPFPTLPLWPDGWFDINLNRYDTFQFHALAAVDPESRRVFPKIDADLRTQTKRPADWWKRPEPWSNFWLTSAVSLSLFYARAQVWLDETRIACALERFHLAHGVYPKSLDELAPACIETLPHDIMNGQPYRYRLQTDGMYLLYSVGWNQTDDGGTVAFRTAFQKKFVDLENGDWVWPTPRSD